MEHLVDAHYVGLPSQGNVYSLTPLLLPSGAHKIILATLRRRVLSFRYHFTNDSSHLKPLVREVHFTCIPNNTEIVSIDAFSRGPSGEDYVIGITLIKQAQNSAESSRPEAYLNVYSDQETESNATPSLDRAASTDSGSAYVAGGSTPHLDNAAQNCRMVELCFAPYQLSHIKLPRRDENLWLLGGGDCHVHLFKEDVSQNSYTELKDDGMFPEFSEALSSPPLWTDIHYKNKVRLCAIGCECGYLKVVQSSVSETGCEITASWDLQLQGPISSVRFFTLANEMHHQTIPDHFNLNLLVACAIQPSQVFMNVNSLGLSNGKELPESASGDAVLCAMTGDTDLDGSVEILLGTYGRQLLVYKWDSSCWYLGATRTLPHPVHSLHYLDVTGDCVKELLILTPKGLHVFQHHLEHVEDRIENFVNMILNSPSGQPDREEANEV